MGFDSDIRSRYRPSIAVSCDLGTELILCKNGLTLVDLLRQHGNSVFTEQQRGPPIRVGENATVRPDTKFSVRFYDASALNCTPVAETGAVLADYMQVVLQQHTDRINGATVLESLRSQSNDPPRDVTPWFTHYSREFTRTLLFRDHESFDHPLSIVYAIDARVDDVNAAATTLYQASINRSTETWGMQRETVYPFHDATFPRHYILVHDASDSAAPNPAELEAKFQQLISGAGRKRMNCSILRVNQGANTPDGAGLAVNWAGRRARSLPGTTKDGVVATGGEPLQRPDGVPGGLGKLLNQSDLKNCASLVSDVVVKTLLPAMERRMEFLRKQTDEHRGSVKKAFKSAASFLGFGAASASRSSQTGGQGGADTGLYKYNSPEGMMRQLGDVACMLGAWDIGEMYFKEIAEEYKKSSAMRHYASASEATALARYMQLPAKPTEMIWNCFANAFDAYSSIANAQDKAYAVRCAILQAKAYRSLRMLDGAYKAFSAAAITLVDNSTMTALLLEQAAICKGLDPVPKYRKFAFYMVLAGFHYSSAGLIPLCIMAHKAALSVIKKQPWALIQGHLSEKLASFCKRQALWKDAAIFLRDTITTPSEDVDQVAALQGFMGTLQGALQVGVDLYLDPDVMALPVPEVDSGHCHVLVDGHQVSANHAARQVDEARWQAFEDCIVTGSHTAYYATREPRSFPTGFPYSTTFACEPVRVQLRIRNPLQIPLVLKDVRLACVFTDSRPAGMVKDEGGVCTDVASDDDVKADAEDIELQAGELVTRWLCVYPQRKGWLQVARVMWTVCAGKLHAYGCSLPQPMAARMRYTDDETSLRIARVTKGMPIADATRCADCEEPPLRHSLPSQRLTFQVLAPNPLLHITPAIPGDIDMDIRELQLAAQDPELVESMFNGEAQALREDVFVGELVPLHLVISKPAGAVENVRLATTCAHVSILPSLTPEVLTTLSGDEVVPILEGLIQGNASVASKSRLRHQASTLPYEGTEAPPVFSFTIGDDDWQSLPDAAHLPVTLWSHCPEPGPMEVPLVLYYESQDGDCRTIRFTHTLTASPAIDDPTVQVVPTPHSLTLSTVRVPLATSVPSTSQNLTVQALVCLSNKWRISALAEPPLPPTTDGPTPDEPTTSDDSQGACRLPAPGLEVVSSMLALDTELTGTPCTLRAQLEPFASSAHSAKDDVDTITPSGSRPNLTESSHSSVHDAGAHSSPSVLSTTAEVPRGGDVKLFALWRLSPVSMSGQASSSARVGVTALHVPDGSMEGLMSALRMTATVPTKAITAEEGASVTHVRVSVRVRNCSMNTMSICMEGNASAITLATQGTAGRWVSHVEGSRYHPPLDAPFASVHACKRHQWVGQTRIQIAELQPQEEVEQELCVMLHGKGVFVIDDYMCTWSISDLDMLNACTPGQSLMLHVVAAGVDPTL